MAGLVNIGFGNLVNDQKISVVVNPECGAGKTAGAERERAASCD